MQFEFQIVGDDFVSAGESSSKIKRILQQVGLPSSVIRRIAIAAYEAEMNIVIHADGGTLTLLVSEEGVRIIAADRGPGIADVELAMQEGYSTASDEVREMGFGAGMGLPNMRRSSDAFVIDTEEGKGTIVTMTFNYN